MSSDKVNEDGNALNTSVGSKEKTFTAFFCRVYTKTGVQIKICWWVWLHNNNNKYFCLQQTQNVIQKFFILAMFCFSHSHGVKFFISDLITHRQRAWFVQNNKIVVNINYFNGVIQNGRLMPVLSCNLIVFIQ